MNKKTFGNKGALAARSAKQELLVELHPGQSGYGLIRGFSDLRMPDFEDIDSQ